MLSLFLITVLNAQTITTGEITGTITDATGAVIIGATVLLKSAETGESRTTQSNAAGVYRFSLVNPGEYELSGSAAGLKSNTERLTAAVGQAVAVDLKLKVEGAKTVVLVMDAAPLIQTENANITYTISTRQLELLPLPGADLVAVAYSIPGVVINNRFGTGNFAAQGVGSVSNLFTVNGVDDMVPNSNVNNSGPTGLLLGANEIREASVVQNAYEGQYGRQAGAQVNYISRSGANSYHGNLTHSYNGAVLNANDFFANATGTPRIEAVSNQYAAAAGGRIIRDKLFFFADTEGLRYALAGSAAVVAIPSQAFETYSLRMIQPAQVPLYQKMFALYNNAPGHERAVPVITGNGPLQDRSGALGCGALAGAPTGSGGVFGKDVSCAQAWGTYVPNQTSEWLLSTRVDYNLNPRHRLFFRFKTDHGRLAFSGNPINPAFSGVSTQPDYEGQLNHTFIITPRLVNNFIGAVTYNDYVFAAADLPSALQLFPFRFNIFDGGANGGGLAPLGAPAAYPSGQRAGQLQIIDDLSWNVARHSLKAGVNYRYQPESNLQYSGLSEEGRFNFFGLDELAGGAINPSSGTNYAQRFTATPVLHLRLYNVGAYLQDQWAISPRLKFTAAIRFDRTGNPQCQEHCFARLASPFAELPKGVGIPYNQSIKTGLSEAFYRTEALVPQPRLSAVYTPQWAKGFTLRGGIGLFSDLYAPAFAGTVAGNAPNVFTATVRTGLVNTGGPASAPAIAASSANAFETQFAAGATLPQLQQAVAPAIFTAPGYLSLPATIRSPKYLEWSFEMERRVGNSNAVTLRYAGNYGYDLFTSNSDVNANANPAAYPQGFGGLSSAAPDPRFAGVNQLENSGYSHYAGLVAIFRRGFGHGIEGQASYTWSHALDTISNGGISLFSYDSTYAQIDPRNLRSLNYSSADYDVRHNVTGDWIWQAPVKFSNRAVNSLLSGWSLATRWSAHTGTPFSVSNGQLGGRVSSTGTVTILADVLDTGIRTTCGHSAVNTPCFTAGQFKTTATQTDFGNRPRNSFRGPGFFEVDASVYKSVPIRERVRLMLGASAYNLLNHPNFADPNSNVAASGFGLIQFTAVNPSSPYGIYGGPSGRAVVVMGRLAF